MVSLYHDKLCLWREGGREGGRREEGGERREGGGRREGGREGVREGE